MKFMFAKTIYTSLEICSRSAYEAIENEAAETQLPLDKSIVLGSQHHDQDIAGDLLIKSALHKTLKMVSDDLPIRRVVMEGDNPYTLNQNGKVDIYIDPLDGSLNFLKRNKTLGLPYTFVATIMPVVEDRPLLIGDTLAGIVTDLRNKDTYIGIRHGDKIRSTVNGTKTEVDSTATIIDGQHIYFSDQYYAETRRMITHLAGDKKGWFRNAGSAAYEMVSVGSGLAAQYLSPCQKMHELGAAWIFNKGAGASCLTLEGDSLADQPFDFSSQQSVGFFATEALAKEVLQAIR